jgi:hypothetical protein
MLADPNIAGIALYGGNPETGGEGDGYDDLLVLDFGSAAPAWDAMLTARRARLIQEAGNAPAQLTLPGVLGPRATDPAADLNGDGRVDVADVILQTMGAPQ